MRNRLIDAILFLLAVSLLCPCPLLPVQLSDRLVGQGPVFTEVVAPPALASSTPGRQAQAGVLAQLDTGGCTNDFAEPLQAGAIHASALRDEP